MKKYKIFVYMILISIIVAISFVIFNSVSKASADNSTEKSTSEIKYLEDELVNMLNTMNNIESRNYNISISQMPNQSDKSTSGGGSDSGGGSSSKGGVSSNSESGGGGSSSEGQTTAQNLNSGNDSTQDNKKFELKSSGVLTNEKDVNWDIVKSEVENLYLSIPTMTIDLYNQNINQQDILNFNKDFDNLAKAVKDEKKVETLTGLSKVYDYLPKFVEREDELYKTLVETKSNIFKAYSKLEEQKWDEISNDIKSAINVYSSLLTNPNIEGNKQYSINKVYIMLNELQNAVSLKDTSIFLIKYKNLLEEIENI